MIQPLAFRKVRHVVAHQWDVKVLDSPLDSSARMDPIIEAKWIIQYPTDHCQHPRHSQTSCRVSNKASKERPIGAAYDFDVSIL
jgi:hypothetical protein